MLKFGIASVLHHKLRLALTGIAVVLGVAFVSGSFIYTDTSTRFFDHMFTQVNQNIDLIVRRPQQLGKQSVHPNLPAKVLKQVRSTPGVAVAEGSVQGSAVLLDKHGKAIVPSGPPTLAYNWTSSKQLQISHIQKGRGPRKSDEVAIDVGTAKKYHFKVGDTVKVMASGPVQSYRLVGTFKVGSMDSVAGATIVTFSTPTAMKVLNSPQQYAEIDIAVQSGSEVSKVQQALKTTLGARYQVVTGKKAGQEQADQIQQGLSFFRTALLSFAGVSLFVGAFIIFNTFTIVFAQRLREFSLLRCVGATAGQVLRMVFVEALFVGVVASIIGMVLGIGIAYGLQAMLSSFGIALPSAHEVIAPRTVVVSLVVGIVITLISAAIPAIGAARTTPVSGLGAVDARERSGWRRPVFGVLLLALGGIAIGMGLTTIDTKPLAWVGAGAGGIFLGMALLTPYALIPVTWLTRVIFGRMWRTPGHLACANVSRHRNRFGTAAAALTIGLGLVAFASVLGASVKHMVTSSFDQFHHVNVYISAPAAFGPSGGGIPISAEQKVSATKGVRSVGGIRAAGVYYAGSRGTVMGVDPKVVSRMFDPGFTAGSFGVLGAHDVVLETDIAEDRHLAVGDTTTMKFANGKVAKLRVSGLFTSTAIGKTAIINQQTFDALQSNPADAAMLVEGQPGVSSQELKRSINKSLKTYPTATVETFSEYEGDTLKNVDQLLGMITAMLALAFLIAVLGIVNTLALSVLERTREIGLLRAVGMIAPQVRRMVRVEAVILAVVGAILGVLAGIGLGWAIITALHDQGLTSFAVPAGQLILLIVVGAIVGLVAAIFPARRAAKLDVLQALQAQ